MISSSTSQEIINSALKFIHTTNADGHVQCAAVLSVWVEWKHLGENPYIQMALFCSGGGSQVLGN